MVNWYLQEDSLLAEDSQIRPYVITEDIAFVVEVFNAQGYRNLDTLRVSALVRPLVDLGPDRELCYGSETSLTYCTFKYSSSKFSFTHFSGHCIIFD